VSVTGAAFGWRAATLAEQATDLDRQAIAETLLQQQVEANALAQVRDEERLFVDFRRDLIEARLFDAEAAALRDTGASNAAARAEVEADDLFRQAGDRARLFEFVEYLAEGPDEVPEFDVDQRFDDLVAQDPSFREVDPERTGDEAEALRASSLDLSGTLIVLAAAVVGLTIAEVSRTSRLRVLMTAAGAGAWAVGVALASGSWT